MIIANSMLEAEKVKHFILYYNLLNELLIYEKWKNQYDLLYKEIRFLSFIT